MTDKVYCSRCKYLINNYICKHPKNYEYKNDGDNWLMPTTEYIVNILKPRIKNKDNNCPDYEKNKNKADKFRPK